MRSADAVQTIAKGLRARSPRLSRAVAGEISVDLRGDSIAVTAVWVWRGQRLQHTETLRLDDVGFDPVRGTIKKTLCQVVVELGHAFLNARGILVA